MQIDLYTGKRIDDFIVEERIGRGGMSVVYRAYQPSVNRHVALKVIGLDPELGDQNEFRRRFAQEAEMIASLEHIHILPVYDYGIIENEIAYLAMRLLRGGSLGGLLTNGPLPFERAAELFTQIARGLHFAHSKGVIHRDIKPSNILLDETGNAYLTDFGLAKLVEDSLELTKAGNIVGTPVYMSPEQLRGESIDHRADIYSLGIVLFHMLTGRPPFDASDTNIISVIYQHLEKAPPSPSSINADVPPDVEAIVLRALEKDPDDRFDDAEAMAEALNLALGRRISTASYPAVRPISRPSSSSQRMKAVDKRGRPRRRRLYIGLAVILALVLFAGGAAVVTRFGQPATFPPPMVIQGEKAVADDAQPTDAEIARARARLGENFIAYVACNQTSEYHATQAREMGDFAARYGLDYRIYDGDNEKARQIPLIERARAEGARLIIVCPLDITLLDGALADAQEAGIPLVFMASDIPSYGGVLLSGDDYLMGRAAGEFAGQIIRDKRAGQANVVILDFPDLPVIITRANGIEDGVRALAPDASIVGRYLGGTGDNGEASIRTLLEDDIAFDVIVSINDAGAFGAIEALEAAGIAPDAVDIVSIDAEALARQYIRQDYFMRGSVEVGRERFSQTAINAAVKLLAGSTLPESYLVPPGAVVTAETLAAEAGDSA